MALDADALLLLPTAVALLPSAELLWPQATAPVPVAVPAPVVPSSSWQDSPANAGEAAPRAAAIAADAMRTETLRTGISPM